ncbi:MAG: adenosylcobinamide-GDP ribazoletransferase [Methanobacteriaceae archaeon]|nr:adenosylcobinamide-GDP ribazoletransferase [Methanobacteriaceae archaeon]
MQTRAGDFQMLQRKEKPLRSSSYHKSLNRQEEHVWYRGIPGLISFSTILLINIHTSIAEMARYTWMWPLIGGFIGVLVGSVGLILSNVFMFSPIVTAAVVYSFAIWFTGFHHLDGLMDLGDALMAHGTPERKIEIMRDLRIGTGGIALFFIVAVTTVAAIASLPTLNIFLVLFISEIAAKMGLVSCCLISTPIGNGTGRHFIEAINLPYFILITLITSIIGLLALNWVGLIGILGGITGGLITALYVKINMKYATGDVLGASNEVARMTAILAMILAFIWI